MVSGYRRRGVTIAETLMVGAIGAAMLGLLLPAISAAIANSQGSRCRNNLARLANALSGYHDAQGKFPPGMQEPTPISGGGYVSDRKPNWIILTLPYLGQQTLYDSVNWTQLNQTQGGLTAFISGVVRYDAFTSTDVPGLLCSSDSYNTTKYRVNRITSTFVPPVYQTYSRSNYSANACLMPPFNYGDYEFWSGIWCLSVWRPDAGRLVVEFAVFLEDARRNGFEFFRHARSDHRWHKQDDSDWRNTRRPQPVRFSRHLGRRTRGGK